MTPIRRNLGFQNSRLLRPSAAWDFVDGNAAGGIGKFPLVWVRATAGTTKDWEGRVWNCLSGEIRASGMRRVRNRCRANTEDGTSALWVPTGTASVGNSTTPKVIAITLPASLDAVYFRNNSDATVGDTIIVSCDVRVTSGTGTIQAIDPFAAQYNIASVDLTTEWKRIFVKFTATNTAQGMSFRRNGVGMASDIEVRRPLIEYVGQQSNQNPGEYVPVLATAGDWGIAGVQYFPYENGNTGVGNLVTEAIGRAFTNPPLGAIKEPASSNLVSRSQDTAMTNWIAASVSVTGSMTLGDLVLPLLTDADGGVAGNYAIALTYVGNGSKGTSLFAKENTAAEFTFGILDSTAAAWRLLVIVVWGANGIPTYTTLAGTIEELEYHTNGVWRFKYFADNVVAANVNSLVVYPAGATAASTGSTYVGGFQAENINKNTSYIIANAAAGVATPRDEDSFSLATGSWYNPSQGTLTLEGSIDGTVRGDETLLGFSDGTFNNVMAFQRIFAVTPDRMQAFVITGGVLQASAAGPGWPTPIKTPFNIGFSYKAADFRFGQSYMEPVSSVPITVPTVTSLISAAGSQFYIRKLSYYRNYIY